MAIHLLHLGLPVRDQQRSMRFYDPVRLPTWPCIRARRPSSPPSCTSGSRCPPPAPSASCSPGWKPTGCRSRRRWEEPGYVAFKCLDPDGWRVEVYWEPIG